MSNNLDSGAGSLRQAIADACDGSTITFNMATVTSPISLTTAELNIGKNLTITGPGSTQLTIERNAAQATPQFRILHIPFNSTTVNISGLTLTNGHAAHGVPGGFAGGPGADGGGIRNTATLSLSDVRITGNQSGNGGTAVSQPGSGGEGGGIYNDSSGALTMTNCVVNGNRSGDAGTSDLNAGFSHGGDGAGIYFNGGKATLTNVIISNNTAGVSTLSGGAGGMGGGFYLAAPGTVSMDRSVVSNNSAGHATAAHSSGFAGGIFTEGLLTITNSTISGNVSETLAGGIMNRGFAVLRLSNSTISANTAELGGGLYGDSSSFTFLTNCTVTNNTSVNVDIFNAIGGIYSASLTTELRNTIVAGNNPVKDVFGNFISRGNNLIGISAAVTGFTNGVNADQIGSEAAPIDPRLGPLANNGGPTQTHALLSGSSALDAGNNCVLDNSCSPAVGLSLTTDQRGAPFARAADSADANATQTVDIGAFEAQAGIEDIANKFDS